MTKKQAMNLLIEEATESLYYKDNEWYTGDYATVEASLLLSITGKHYNQSRLVGLYEVLQRSEAVDSEAVEIKQRLIGWMEQKEQEGYRFLNEYRERMAKGSI